MIKLKQNSFIQKLFLIYVISLTLGNGVYFYMSLIRLDLIMILPTFIITSYFLINKKLNFSNLLIFILIISYLANVSLYIFVIHSSTARLDLYYMLSIYNLMVLLYLLISNKKLHKQNILFIYKSLYFVLIFILISIIFEIITGYRFTANNDDGIKSLLISSFFDNPNNLASTSLMIFLATYFLARKIASKKSILILVFIEAIILIITMSRATLFLFIIVLLITQLTNILLIFLLGLIFLYISSNFENILLNLIHSNIELISINANRLWLAIYGLDSDKSVSYRADIYNYFFHHLNQFNFIGYGPRNYIYFFHSNDLASINPHSFLIENFLAFGLIGGILFLVIMLLLIVKSIVQKKYDLLILTIVFLLVTFVPSSTLRLELMWLPLFLFYFIKYKKGKII